MPDQAEIERRIQIDLNKNEAIALINLASFALLMIRGDRKRDIVALREGYASAQRALDRLGPDGWSAMGTRYAKHMAVAFPEVAEMGGHIETSWKPK